MADRSYVDTEFYAPVQATAVGPVVLPRGLGWRRSGVHAFGLIFTSYEGDPHESCMRCEVARGAWALVIDDFKLAKALGKPLRDQAQRREWEQGVSIFDSLDYAQQRARAFRFALGRFVVAIRVPDDGRIEVAQTGNDRHHFTIYAEPERLVSLVDGDAVRVQEH